MPIKLIFRFTFLLLLSINARAMLMVESVFPLPYSTAVTEPVSMTLTMSSNIHAPSVSSSSVKICGQFSGSLPAEDFQVIVANDQISLNVTADFPPGEQVTVSLFDIISEDLTDTLKIFSWVFNMGAAPGLANFNREANLTIEANASIRNLRCLDWNEDGLVDILFTTTSDHAFYICTNTGQGTFSPPLMYPVEIIPTAVGLGDFNNDHYTDIVVNGFAVGEDEAGQGIVFLNDQASGVIEGLAFDAGPEPGDLLLVDLNQDFMLDILAANTADNYFRVLINDGLDGFDTILVPLNDFSQFQLSVADFQNDGIQEILYFQNDAGAGGHLYAMDQIDWALTPILSIESFFNFPAPGDLSGDHLVDLILDHSLFLNTGDPASWQLFSTISDYICLTFDNDQDGDLDMISSGYLMRLHENDGAGNFSTTWEREGFGEYAKSEIIDFDNDQDLDFILSDNNQILFFSNSQDVTPPNPPQLWQVLTDSTENWIRWNRGGRFDNYLYEIYRGINRADSLGLLASVLYPTSEYVDTSGISRWNTYYYAVRAQDAFGNTSAFSDTLFVNTIPPDPVHPIINEVEVDTNSVTLIWNRIADSYYIDHYVVYRRDLPDSELMPVANIPAASNRYVDQSVETNRTYRYAVASVNQIGQTSTLSPEVEVSTNPGSPGWVDLNSLSYYPLQTGNFWQYQHTYRDIWSGTTTSYYSMEVVGDTLNPQTGINQQIVQRGGQHTLWYIDTLTTIVYQNDRSIYRLNSEVGDTVFDWGHLSTYDNVVLGCTTSVKYYHKGQFEQESQKLASGFGFVSYSYSYVDVSSESILIYARINGVEYGTYLGVEQDANPALPSRYALLAYPNPFNSVINILVEGDGDNPIDLVILNLLGQQIESLKVVPTSRGLMANWNAHAQPSGIYIISARSLSGQSVSKKIALIK